MHPLLRKLNVKGHSRLVALAAPPELGPTLEAMKPELLVRTRLGAREELVLVFVRRGADIEARAAEVVAALADDALMWWAYPKKSSRRYQTDIGRDEGWQVLGAMGFEPVRQIAIDEDWSAVRFRRAEAIKSMTRDPSRAMSELGRARVAAKKASVKKASAKKASAKKASAKKASAKKASATQPTVTKGGATVKQAAEVGLPQGMRSRPGRRGGIVHEEGDSPPHDPVISSSQWCVGAG